MPPQSVYPVSAGPVLVQCLVEQPHEPVPVPLRRVFVVHEMATHRKPMLGVLVGLDSVVHTGSIQRILQALTLLVGEGWIDARGADVDTSKHFRCEQCGLSGFSVASAPP